MGIGLIAAAFVVRLDDLAALFGRAGEAAPGAGMR
jgi:hypothetical protein